MDIAKRQLIVSVFITITSPMIFVACTTVMKYTPQEMSDLVIGHINHEVDPKSDPMPQTLVIDEAACTNMVRLQYPIAKINEGGIITGNMLLGAAGGASSGAAGAAGTGHAGQAAALV